MAEDKHAHNWVEISRATNVRRGKWVISIYYKCTGCPLTKTETEEK